MKPLRWAIAALALFAAAEARAETPPACAGKDLVETLRRTDPAAYQKFLAETGRIANAEGLLWRVEKPGVPDSYLFGTMHATDERLETLAPEVEQALAASKVMALELEEVGGGKRLQEEMGKIFAARGIDPAGRGLDGIAKKDREAVVRALAERGVSALSARQLKPWALLVLMSVPTCEMLRSAAGLEVVDSRLAHAAERGGIRLVGLETIDEQMRALESIPPATALRMVTGMAKLGPALDDVFETMVGLYQRRQIGYLLADLSLAGVAPDEVGDFTSFMETLVDKRNFTMRDRAKPLLEQGNAFIGVGALHLVGEKGLVELFRKEGFTLTRVW